MPLFGNKFLPVKYPVRRKLHFHNQHEVQLNSKGPIKMNLGNYQFEFSDGDWKPVAGKDVDIYNENENLKLMSSQLKEENNLLKLKIEILLDMLTEEAFKTEQRKNGDTQKDKYLFNN